MVRVVTLLPTSAGACEGGASADASKQAPQLPECLQCRFISLAVFGLIKDGFVPVKPVAAQCRHNSLLAAWYRSRWIDIIKTQPPNTAVVARIQKAGECRNQRACVQGACG